MKIVNLYAKVKILADIYYEDVLAIPAGTVGLVVDCEEAPTCYGVEFSVPSQKIKGELERDWGMLSRDQFEVIDNTGYPKS